jgi:hypothetical protein
MMRAMAMNEAMPSPRKTSMNSFTSASCRPAEKVAHALYTVKKRCASFPSPVGM